MRRIAPLLLAAMASLVVAAPLPVQFPAFATFVGTMKAVAGVRISGTPKQKLKDSSPDTLLDLDATAGTYTFHPNGNALAGPMAPGGKPGRFDVVQPTGQALADLISGTQTYFTGTAGIDVTVTDVQVSGTHTMKANGDAVKSAVKFTITGTATALSLPFTAEAKVKFKGPRAAM